MEILSNSSLLISFLSLSTLEIVLGIDNVVFIALVCGNLPEELRERARVVGLTLALIMRIFMLFSVAWIIGLNEPLVNLFGHGLSGKGVLLLLGGIFLIYKATDSIHHEVTGEKEAELKQFGGGFSKVIMQVVLIDLVFSFDSVITAVGIVENIWIIVAAMTLAMIVMIASSGIIANFIETHPSLKMLALSFVMMIGVLLVAESFGFHLPKEYIYFSMAFSLFVEVLNIMARRKKKILEP